MYEIDLKKKLKITLDKKYIYYKCIIINNLFYNILNLNSERRINED